ncbi:MAG: hypothetical protein WBN88_03400 [Anderseniella sp.]
MQKEFQSFSVVDGEMIPALILLADYVVFLEAWQRVAKDGFSLIDFHIPRPKDFTHQSHADAPHILTNRNEYLSAIASYGTHAVSNQHPVSCIEHLICCALAGLRPQGNRVHGNARVPQFLPPAAKNTILAGYLPLASYTFAHYR